MPPHQHHRASFHEKSRIGRNALLCSDWDAKKEDVPILTHPHEYKKNEINPTATLTVKVDIDAKIYCDGDFLDLVEANKVKKIPIETGEHLITIESENVEGVSEDREVDIKEAGKNYLLVIKTLYEKEMEAFQLAEEKRLAEEQERKAAELKKKEEEEQRKKDEYLSNTDFVAKYYDNSEDKVVIKDSDLETIKTTEIVPALKKGNASAAFIHALILMEQYPEYIGGVSQRSEQQESEIVNSLKYAADKNITEAQYRLGLHLRWSNHDVALNYLRAAAEKGNPNAQFRLGNELLDEDDDEAEMWSLKALKNGCMDAYTNFECLSFTRGLPPVFLSEMERIADTGNARANYYLYYIYCYGHLYGFCEDDNFEKLLEPNWDLGIKHLKRSADLGDSDAQFELGKLFEEGNMPDNDDDWGLPNIDEAKKWYRKAAEQGNQEATERLKEI